MTPRFKIHLRDKRATISGVPYDVLASILDSAYIHYSDELRTERKKRKPDPESIEWLEDQLSMVTRLIDSKDEAIRATHPKPEFTIANRKKFVSWQRAERLAIAKFTKDLLERVRARRERLSTQA